MGVYEVQTQAYATIISCNRLRGGPCSGSRRPASASVYELVCGQEPASAVLLASRRGLALRSYPVKDVRGVREEPLSHGTVQLLVFSPGELSIAVLSGRSCGPPSFTRPDTPKLDVNLKRRVR